jgi:hypothetical protein
MEACKIPAPKMKRILENGLASSTQKMPQMLVPAQLNQHEHENSNELDCLLADSSYELLQC